MTARRFAWQRALHGVAVGAVGIAVVTAVIWALSVVTALVVSVLARRMRRRASEAESLAVRHMAREQSALREVAALVARAAAPEEVFAAVTAQVGRLLRTDQTNMIRYDADGAGTVVGMWTGTGAAGPVAVGSRVPLGGLNLTTLVAETCRPARIDDYADASGDAADIARTWGARSSVGVPINVEGRLWGLIATVSRSEQPLPEDTEAQLAGFTELIATAIANVQARLELRGYAAEQAALRRVATLVARAAAPEEVFTAVTAEAGRVLQVDYTTMARYDPDGAVTWVGSWSSTGTPFPIRIGSRADLGGRNGPTLVFETGRPARIDDYAAASGSVAELAQQLGIRSSVGVPINVAGRLWGVIAAVSLREPLPADTEARLAGFTELVATALANAESQAALTASRARIVAAADQARRRLERDLHDGAQQRLVSLAIQLQAVQAAVPPEADELAAQLDELAAEATSTLDELRELAHGIHPAALADGGLRPALRALARRCTVPVELDVRADRRLPEPIEIAVYYLVAEALTNAAKHAHASIVHVQIDIAHGDTGEVLRVCVHDDGRGGAQVGGGSGLVGLKDRAEALGGWLRVQSASGAGTTVRAELPLRTAGAVSG